MFNLFSVTPSAVAALEKAATCLDEGQVTSPGQVLGLFLSAGCSADRFGQIVRNVTRGDTDWADVYAAMSAESPELCETVDGLENFGEIVLILDRAGMIDTISILAEILEHSLSGSVDSA